MIVILPSFSEKDAYCKWFKHVNDYVTYIFRTNCPYRLKWQCWNHIYFWQNELRILNTVSKFLHLSYMCV